MLNKYLRPFLYGLLLYLPGVIFFSTTSPERLPVGLYILPFVYIFLCAYLTSRFLLRRLGGQQRYIRLLPNIIAILLTLVLLLGSLQKLSLGDLLLLFGIGLLLIWYLGKLNPKE